MATRKISTAIGKEQERETAVAALKLQASKTAGHGAHGQAGRPLHELTGMEKISKVRQGMTRQDLEQVKESFGLDYETLARILSVAKATLFNKKGGERFSAGLSEKIFALADLYSYGLTVFGEKTLFNNWMEQPNRALGYTKPVELLDTLIGMGEVKNLVGRIEHGVYS